MVGEGIGTGARGSPVEWPVVPAPVAAGPASGRLRAVS
jgi:hypothetical protein